MNQNVPKEDTIKKQNYSRIEVLLNNNNTSSHTASLNNTSGNPTVLNQIPANIPSMQSAVQNNTKLFNSVSSSSSNSSKQSSAQILKKKNNFINRKTIRNYTAAAAASTANTLTSIDNSNSLIVAPPQTSVPQSATSTSNFNLANSLLLLQPAQTIKHDQLEAK